MLGSTYGYELWFFLVKNGDWLHAYPLSMTCSTLNELFVTIEV